MPVLDEAAGESFRDIARSENADFHVRPPAWRACHARTDGMSAPPTYLAGQAPEEGGREASLSEALLLNGFVHQLARDLI